MKTALVTGACINTGVAIVEKFLSEGYSVIFTGRSPEKVKSAETEYKKKFPEAAVIGYCINSLKDERTVDEEAVEKLFAFMDGKKMLAETVVLNAADQGLEMKIFKNPLADFMRVINTNMTWNYCICEHAEQDCVFGVKKRSARNDACYGAGSRKIQYQSKRSFAGNDKNRPLG